MTLLNSYSTKFTILYIMVMVNNLSQVNAASYELTNNTKFEIKYLTTEGLAQPIRFLLNLMGRRFKDVRITNATWKSGAKKEMPFGHVPVLILDDTIRLTQSTAICRFLATFVHDQLNEVNDWEAYLIDSNVENMQDLRRELIKHIHEINDDKRNKLKAKFENITLPIFLRKFENIVTYNHQHFVRGKLTWADIFFASIANSIGKLINNTSYLDKYHNLKKLTEKVLSIEAIQSWLENPEYIVV